MTAQFPTNIPTYSNPTASMTLGSADHVALHSNVMDDVIAIATKLGKSSSSPANKAALMGTATAGATAYTGSPNFSGTATIEGAVNVGTATGAATGEVKASGSGTFAGGLNVGAATGAAVGEIRTSAAIRSGGFFFPSGFSFVGYKGVAQNQSVVTHTTFTLGNLLGFVLIHNATDADFAIVGLHTSIAPIMIYAGTNFVNTANANDNKIHITWNAGATRYDMYNGFAGDKLMNIHFFGQ